MMKEYQEWLDEQSPSTRQHYDKRMQNFLTSMKLTIEEFSNLTPKEMKHVVLAYRAKSEKEGMPQNSILAHICAVRSYCVSIDKPLMFKKNALGKVQADTDSHVFSNGDLKGLFEIGNVFEKALISTAVSLGWEISSVLEFNREKMKAQIAHAKQNSEQFIFFDDTRQKTGESRFAVLNPLAIEWLTKYLDSSEDSEKLFPITEDGVNKMLKRLGSTSGLKLTGSIRFHNIRKWLMSRLSRCGFNEFQIKYVMGKSIGVSDRTYLQTLQSEIEEKYPKVYNEYLNIVPTLSVTKSKELEELGQENRKLKEKVIDQDMRIEALLTRLEELDPQVREKYDKTLEMLRARMKQEKISLEPFESHE
jgi:flagellar capping protein FliD